MKLRRAAAKLPLKPHEYAQSPRQSRECCQQVPIDLGVLLLFRCALRGRGVQRELPSTITYSQNFRGIAQRKSAHAFWRFFDFSFSL